MFKKSYSKAAITHNKIIESIGPYYKSKLELKSNSNEILPVASLSVLISFLFVLKVKLKDLKFEFCQFKLE